MKIPYLTSKRLANREVAYYFNIPARLILEGCTIKSQPLGKDYFRACQKALEIYEQLKSFKKTGENINIKSASGLWRLYRESRFYKELAERTKKDYAYAFGLIEKKGNKSGQSLAGVSLDLFDNDTAYRLYERLEESYKPRWAKNCIGFLRMLFNFGIRKNIFTCKNPFENLRIKQTKPKKIIFRKTSRALVWQVNPPANYQARGSGTGFDDFLSFQPANPAAVSDKPSIRNAYD